MRYAVIVMLETERSPQNIINEVVSHLEYEVSTKTTVDSVVVLIDDATEVGLYDRKEKE